MESNPLVSVVIPTRNRPAMTAAAVRSVLDGAYPNVEVIVVDGNSEDDTREVCQAAGARVIRFTQEGDHRCEQRNVGVEEARGTYVLIMDSDMTLESGVLAECVALMQSNESISALVVPEVSFGKGFWAQCKSLEKAYYQGVPWMEAARFFRRDLYLQLGGYNPALTSGEDWDLSQRAAERGALGRTVAHINHNEGSMSLWDTVKKKYYYASKFTAYTEQTESVNLGKQTSIVARYALFFSQPRLMLRHPIRWVGMIVMKTSEFGGGAIGLIFK